MTSGQRLAHTRRARSPDSRGTGRETYFVRRDHRAADRQRPSATAQQTQTGARPPVAAKRPHLTDYSRTTLTDDYFWLRQKGDSEVVRHLEAENAYTAAVMKPTETMQQSLYDEMLRRIKQTDARHRSATGDYSYLSRTEEGKQYPIFVRTRSEASIRPSIFDQNEAAKGHGFYSLGAFDVSDDGNLLAYTIDTTGLPAVRASRQGPDNRASFCRIVVPRITSVSWATDSRTLFLTTEDSITKRSYRFCAARRRRQRADGRLRREGRVVRRLRRPIARQGDDPGHVVLEDAAPRPIISGLTNRRRRSR